MITMPTPSLNTKRFQNITIADINADEVIISAADSAEYRDRLPLWEHIHTSDPKRIIFIKNIDKESILVTHDGTEKTVSLRDEDAINDIFIAKQILIDVTGLSHNIWAPLLKSAYSQKIRTRILYAEPESYTPHPSPASSAIFDLSVTFEGLSPLPGFVQLAGPEDEEKCLFIAMLGFEGNRPEHLASQLDPTPKVIPIVGVPGFQLEYPAFTVGCNRMFLDEYRAHSEVRYARASCPFEAFNALNKIRRDYPDHYIYLALVGTKPHAIGSILFAIKYAETTEIMFDYPVKKSGRTSGVGIVHIYDFEDFHAY
ncbi:MULTISPECIES: hypothetical protein [Pseudomonas]|uniref:hypothetical protein n=1 Tax=Pseudomonas TaxID=286 RepID=UPI00068DE423|nr:MULTISPECIES: hypothetical protein [Pseudomonas]MBF4558939.1 hypothetical protein [Pseudomonas sp. p50(2008)]